MKTSQSYKTVLLIAIPACLILFGCNFAAESFNTPTPEDCLSASNSPDDSDVAYALGYTGDIFQSGEWEQTHQIRDERVTVTWRNPTDFSIVHMEYVVFPCGHNDATLDFYFSPTNFETVIFQAYENLEAGNACSNDDTLYLKEFQAISGGLEYDIRFWIVPDQPTRILDIFIAYPVDQAVTLDGYANQLFPELASCQLSK